MASNKNALIRYNTIDKCLRNRNRLWTLEDLMQACSDALYEFEGKDDLVSKRTIQLDIQNMRSEKLGYNAPIEVFQRKYYRYSDPDFSIKNIPINDGDIKVLTNAIQLLKQFQGFSVFKEMGGVIHKLEDSIFYTTRQRAIIHLDKNERLKGLEFIDDLYQFILNKKAITIKYKSFKAREINEYIAHPQLLKEFNNRWFLVVWHKIDYMVLALDRIEEVEEAEVEYIDKNINGDDFFGEVIGVTVSKQKRPRKVIFTVNKENSPYVKTKPFHHTQELIKEENGVCTFKILVQLNFELERLILGFGESITINFPPKLQNRIKTKLSKAIKNYTDE